MEKQSCPSRLTQLSTGAALLGAVARAARLRRRWDVIKIGIPVGLSGANSVVAPSVVQSAELAVEEINAKRRHPGQEGRAGGGR